MSLYSAILSIFIIQILHFNKTGFNALKRCQFLHKLSKQVVKNSNTFVTTNCMLMYLSVEDELQKSVCDPHNFRMLSDTLVK